MNLDKNKYRNGYMKLIASLDSCGSWEQFESWDRMAQNFFNMINFNISKLKRYPFWYFWHYREFRKWMDEVEFMFEDIKQRRQEFYNYNKKIEKEHRNPKPKPPVVIKGFQLAD